MTLKPHQLSISVAAAFQLQECGFVYLSMQPRTGKTLTSLNAAKLCGATNVLFVTKKKALSSIVADYELGGFAFQFLAINYDKLHLITPSYDFVILDEAHSLGAFPKPSQRAERLRKITKGCKVIYLSATPSPESQSQLYHQLWAGNVQLWSQYANFYKWHKEYGVPKKKYLYNREMNDYSDTQTEKVDKDIAPHFIACTQQEAGITCEVEERIEVLPMPPVVSLAINKLKKDKVLTTKAGYTILADTAVKEMSKVHQFCGGTVITEEGATIIIDRTKAAYIAANYAGQSIAIYYKFKAEFEALKEVFPEYVTDAMQYREKGGVFLSQIQSGREGLDLSTADTLIFYNIDFAAVSYWQTIARLQKMGKEKPAKIVWLFFAGGLEEKIYKVVLDKKDFTLAYYRRG